MCWRMSRWRSQRGMIPAATQKGFARPAGPFLLPLARRLARGRRSFPCFPGKAVEEYPPKPPLQGRWRGVAEGVGIPAERDTVKPRFGALNDCFAALMAATKFHFDGPSFTPMDQDSRGPWTRSPTRPHHPFSTRETGRGRPVFGRRLVARKDDKNEFPW